MGKASRLICVFWAFVWINVKLINGKCFCHSVKVKFEWQARFS